VLILAKLPGEHPVGDPGARPFKKGIFHVAMHAAAPIVPIGIRVASELMQRDATTIHAGSVQIAVLPAALATKITVIARHDRRQTVSEPSVSRTCNQQRCPAAAASQHVPGRHGGHVAGLSQGHLPLVQIASIGRLLQWVHRAGRLVRAEHRAAPAQEQTACTPPSPASSMVVW
jgi:hypothetical protein